MSEVHVTTFADHIETGYPDLAREDENALISDKENEK